MSPIRCIVTCALLVVAASTLSGADEKDDKATEVKKLQGTWTIASGEFSGNAMTAKDLRRSIDRGDRAGEMVFMKGDKEVAAYPFEVFPDKKPRDLFGRWR